jgi:hypothetical protein
MKATATATATLYGLPDVLDLIEDCTVLCSTVAARRRQESYGAPLMMGWNREASKAGLVRYWAQAGGREGRVCLNSGEKRGR